MSSLAPAHIADASASNNGFVEPRLNGFRWRRRDTSCAKTRRIHRFGPIVVTRPTTPVTRVTSRVVLDRARGIGSSSSDCKYLLSLSPRAPLIDTRRFARSIFHSSLQAGLRQGSRGYPVSGRTLLDPRSLLELPQLAAPRRRAPQQPRRAHGERRRGRGVCEWRCGRLRGRARDP